MKVITDKGTFDTEAGDFLEKGKALPGGEAEKQKKTEKDFPPEAVKQGIKVEMEHTDDPKVAKEIALDHLAESPKYYDKLKVMEEELEEDEAKKAEPTTPEEEAKRESKMPDAPPPPIPGVPSVKKSGLDSLDEYLEKGRNATPIGGKTESGLTVKMVGGKRVYFKEGEGGGSSGGEQKELKDVTSEWQNQNSHWLGNSVSPGTTITVTDKGGTERTWVKGAGDYFIGIAYDDGAKVRDPAMRTYKKTLSELAEHLSDKNCAKVAAGTNLTGYAKGIVQGNKMLFSGKGANNALATWAIMPEGREMKILAGYANPDLPGSAPKGAVISGKHRSGAEHTVKKIGDGPEGRWVVVAGDRKGKEYSTEAIERLMGKGKSPFDPKSFTFGKPVGAKNFGGTEKSMSGIESLDDYLEKSASHKYLRRWKGKDGSWNYEYKQEKGGKGSKSAMKREAWNYANELGGAASKVAEAGLKESIKKLKAAGHKTKTLEQYLSAYQAGGSEWKQMKAKESEASRKMLKEKTKPKGKDTFDPLADIMGAKSPKGASEAKANLKPISAAEKKAAKQLQEKANFPSVSEATVAQAESLGRTEKDYRGYLDAVISGDAEKAAKILEAAQPVYPGEPTGAEMAQKELQAATEGESGGSKPKKKKEKKPKQAKLGKTHRKALGAGTRNGVVPGGLQASEKAVYDMVDAGLMEYSGHGQYKTTDAGRKALEAGTYTKKKVEKSMSGIEALGEFAKARNVTPVGGKTESGLTVKMVNGKRVYEKEGEGKPKKSAQPLTDDEKDAADELMLFLENDSDIYRQREAFEANVVKKMAAGKYDSAKAGNLWKYLAERAAKKYKKEVGDSGDYNFTPKVRLAVGKELAKDFEQMVKDNPENYDQHVPKKYKEGWKAKDADKRSMQKKVIEAKAGDKVKFKNGDTAVKMEGDKWTLTTERGSTHEVYDGHVKGRLEGIQFIPKGGGGGKSEKLDAIWKKMHSDYKSDSNGVKKVMVMRSGGSTLVPLTELTSAEVDKLSGGNTKKSLEDWLLEDMLEKAWEEDMEEYLEKADSLPSGQPKMGGTGGEQGGTLAGKGKQSGSSDSAATPGQGAPAPKKQKLSEDDEDDEKQMKPHKKPIEKLSSARKSLDGTARSQMDAVAYEQAQEVSRLRKGDEDVTVGVGIAPPQAPVVERPEAHLFMQKGGDSMVVYSDEADRAATELMKADREFYPMGAPTISGNSALVHQQTACPACGHSMAKSLSVCPTCGHGEIVHRHIPGMTLEKSEETEVRHGPVLRPAKAEEDLYLPAGVNIEDE